VPQHSLTKQSFSSHSSVLVAPTPFSLNGHMNNEKLHCREKYTS